MKTDLTLAEKVAIWDAEPSETPMIRCASNSRTGLRVDITLGELRDAVRGIDLPAIDAAHIAHQAAWSEATFGPGERVYGVLDHISKELDEVRNAYNRGFETLPEWVDLIILAIDGAWRSGATPQQIIDGVQAKQARNEARTWPDWRTADPARTWPDWRTADPGKAIEHDRSVQS